MVKDPADKIREIKPFGPQLPKDGPYKYRRPWQSWTGGDKVKKKNEYTIGCLLYTSPSPRDGLLSRMPSSA